MTNDLVLFWLLSIRWPKAGDVLSEMPLVWCIASTNRHLSWECFFVDQHDVRSPRSICKNEKRPFWTQDFDDEQPLTTGGWKNFCALFRGDDLGQPLAPSRRSRCCYLVEIAECVFFSAPCFFLPCYFRRDLLNAEIQTESRKTEYLPCMTITFRDLCQGFCCCFTGIESTSEVEVSLKKNINYFFNVKATCLNRSLSYTAS